MSGPADLLAVLEVVVFTPTHHLYTHHEGARMCTTEGVRYL